MVSFTIEGRSYNVGQAAGSVVNIFNGTNRWLTKKRRKNESDDAMRVRMIEDLKAARVRARHAPPWRSPQL